MLLFAFVSLSEEDVMSEILVYVMAHIQSFLHCYCRVCQLWKQPNLLHLSCACCGPCCCSWRQWVGMDLKSHVVTTSGIDSSVTCFFHKDMYRDKKNCIVQFFYLSLTSEPGRCLAGNCVAPPWLHQDVKWNCCVRYLLVDVCLYVEFQGLSRFLSRS